VRDPLTNSAHPLPGRFREDASKPSLTPGYSPHPSGDFKMLNHNKRNDLILTNWLLCDFHIHTDMSDGNLPLNEVIDLFGEEGFDAISITDHIFDEKTLEEEIEKREINAITRENFHDYLRLLWKESKRAWEEYRMLVIPGVELTNNQGKYHILAIDIKEYIDPALPVRTIVEEIHSQEAIAIACHPHHKQSEGRQPFIHLWNHRKEYEGDLRRLGGSQPRRPLQRHRPKKVQLHSKLRLPRSTTRLLLEKPNKSRKEHRSNKTSDTRKQGNSHLSFQKKQTQKRVKPPSQVL